MPQIQEKIITLSNFYAGQAAVDMDKDSEPGECGYAQEMNLIFNAGFLTPNAAMVDDSGGMTTVGKRLEGYATGPGTSTSRYSPFIYTVAYYLDSGTSKYIQQSMVKGAHTDSWTTLHTATTGQAAEITEAVIKPWVIRYGDDLYWPSRLTGSFKISRNGVEDWDNLGVTAWGGSPTNLMKEAGAMVHTDGAMYLWADRFIGPYDGVTKPSLITPVDIPTDYVIVDAISLRNKILIAGNHRTNSLTSKLFLYDPYSPLGLYTFDDIFETSFYNIQAIRVVEGVVKVITATGDYGINDWIGGDYIVPSRKLSVGTVSAINVNRTAVDLRRNTMYFGTNNSISGFNAGIYTYGRDTTQDPWSVSNEHINHSADVSSVNYRHIKWWNLAGDERLYANWYDGTNYGMSRLGTSKANGIYETVNFRPFQGLKSQIVKATIYHEPIPASCSYVVSEKKDGGNYTAITGSIGTANAVKTVIRNNSITVVTASAETTIQIGAGTSLLSAFLKGYKHKLKVAFTSNSTDAVKIEKIKLRVRTEEQD